MIKLDDHWDYECFCKKGHVSYSGRHNKSTIKEMFGTQAGGYRESCEEFSCKGKESLKSSDISNKRYKVFVPEEPLAWEAAKQMVKV